MDFVIFERILNEANSMGVKKVAFSGGEPLLWNDIAGAISKTLEYDIHTTLYTTGNVSNAKKMMLNLHSAGLNRVILSIYGTSSAEHEAVTNCKSSYERTIRIARYCSEIGLDTEFHFVPLSWNYRILPQIADLAKEIGIRRTSILRLVPQGRAGRMNNGQLNNFQNIELRNTIKSLRKNGHDIRIGSPYNFLMLRENPHCRSGIDRMTIGPDYRIFPCDAFKHISPGDIGESSEYSNLRNYTLKECWEKSPYFTAVRKYLMTDMPTECRSCFKLKECNSGCLAQKFYAYGGLLKSPDPMCLLGAKIGT